MSNDNNWQHYARNIPMPYMPGTCRRESCTFEAKINGYCCDGCSTIDYLEGRLGERYISSMDAYDDPEYREGEIDELKSAINILENWDQLKCRCSKPS